MDVISLIKGDIANASPAELEAYLAGAAHDATYSRAHGTTRFCQADKRWIDSLASILERVGKRAWVYREGATRDCWIVESTWRPRVATADTSAAYVRGYFDAEGGIPRDPLARFYIQLVQKDLADLSSVRSCVEDLGISCGRLHNPSARVDPDYWRFYVLARSHLDFCRVVGSWHPRKREALVHRLQLSARTGQ